MSEDDRIEEPAAALASAVARCPRCGHERRLAEWRLTLHDGLVVLECPACGAPRSP